MTALNPVYVERIAPAIRSPRRRRLFRELAFASVPIPKDRCEAACLRVHISMLRRELDQYGLDIVARRRAGYRLAPRRRPIGGAGE